MFYWIWAVVGCAIVFLWLKKKYAYFKEREVNYVPLFDVFKSTFKTFTKQEHMVASFELAYKSHPSDRFVGNYEFFTPIITIRDPELIKLIGVKDFDHFTNHRSLSQAQDDLFTRTLVALKDQKWREMRATLSPAFTGSKLKNMVPLITECSKDILNDLERQIKEKTDEHLDLDTLDLLSRYTNDVIASCAFGLKTNSVKERDNKFYVMGRKLTTFKFKQVIQVMLLLLMPFIAKIKKINLMPKDAVDFLHDMVISTLKDREEKKLFRPDMIQLLLEARKGTLKHENVKDEKDVGFATVEESAVGKTAIKQGWKDDDLVAQAFLFFFAGFETVSTALTFLLYELAINPDIQDKLRQEIDEHYETNEGKLLFDSIIQLKYLDMVVSESLRLWPPALATDRVCNKPYNLGKPNAHSEKDFILENNASIMIPFWPIHRDSRYYAYPEKFDPERFSDENKHKIKPFTYLPFGIGPRNCIGSRFALMEIKMFTYNLLRRFEVSPAPETVIPAKLAPGVFAMRMEGGHMLRFKCRK